MKLIILLGFFLILMALFGGLYALLKDRGEDQRLVKRLTFRIVFSLLLFTALVLGSLMGFFHPHPLGR